MGALRESPSAAAWVVTCPLAGPQGTRCLICLPAPHPPTGSTEACGEVNSLLVGSSLGGSEGAREPSCREPEGAGHGAGAGGEVLWVARVPAGGRVGGCGGGRQAQEGSEEAGEGTWRGSENGLREAPSPETFGELTRGRKFGWGGAARLRLVQPSAEAKDTRNTAQATGAPSPSPPAESEAKTLSPPPTPTPHTPCLHRSSSESEPGRPSSLTL